MIGAVNLIRSSKPAWHVEISADPDERHSPAEQTVCLLKNEGYEVYWFDGASLRRRRRGDRSVNYFFLTDQHLKAFEKKDAMKVIEVRVGI